MRPSGKVANGDAVQRYERASRPVGSGAMAPLPMTVEIAPPESCTWRTREARPSVMSTSPVGYAGVELFTTVSTRAEEAASLPTDHHHRNPPS